MVVDGASSRMSKGTQGAVEHPHGMIAIICAGIEGAGVRVR